MGEKKREGVFTLMPYAWWLPGIEPPAFADGRFGEAALRLPLATPALVREASARAIAARQRSLMRMPALHIVNVIDAAIANWQNPSYPLRQLAEEHLPKVTGYSPAMICHGLPYVLSTFTRDGLLDLVHSEFGDPLALDECATTGPRLTFHILAGNIPAVPVESIVRALLVKSACLVKPSSRDPLFPALFARSLGEVDPQLADAIAVLWWRGGDAAIDEAAFAQAEAVIAYGGEEAVATTRRRAGPGTTFIGHGPKVSFAAIAREALKEEAMGHLARAAAWDVSLFDQQGCVSPHAVYVESGGALSPLDFARRLAGELEAIERTLPRGRLSADEAAQIQSARATAEMREAAGKQVTMLCSQQTTAWTVIYDGESRELALSCLNRVVRVIPIDDLAAVPGYVRHLGPYLQSVGVAIPESRLPAVAKALEDVGVTRVCELGEMQRPPPSWRHDGQANLGALLGKE